MIIWPTSPILAFIAQILSGTSLAVGVIGGWYWWWRKCREEHIDLWWASDHLWLSVLLSLVVARIAFILAHVSEFGLQFWRWWQLLSSPGLMGSIGIVAGVIYLWKKASDAKLDGFEVLDFFSLFLSWFFIWYWVSRFVVGAGAGASTQLPWGVVFPQRVEAAHPVALYSVPIFIALFGYLLWAEPRYRFFLWYRSRKRTAQTGYLTAVGMMGLGLSQFLLGFVQYPAWPVFGIDLLQVFHCLLFLGGCGLLYFRKR